MKKLLLCLLLVPGVVLAAPPSATLTWTAPTKYTDGTTITVPLTYNVYQGLSGATKTRVLSNLVALTTTITTGLSPNSTVCWELTAVAGGQESAHTAEVCKTFPPQVPEAPAGLTVQ